jgi:hypothetical protein
MLVRVRNNPGDAYFWDGKQGRFTWSWKSGTTGLVIGPIQHIIAGNRFSFNFEVTRYHNIFNTCQIMSVTGVDSIALTHKNGTVTRAMTSSFSLTSIACSCGSKKLRFSLSHFFLR